MRWSSSQTLITGVYRSGTEYLSQLLSGHPRLSCTMYHVNALRFVLNRYEPLGERKNLDRALADMNARLGKRYGLSVDADRVIDRMSSSGFSNWAGLYDAVMSELWLGEQKEHWAEKCQLVWREIPQFLREMPNGKAILLIRDPRSVTASFQRFTHAPAPAYLGAVFNSLDALQHAMKFQETLDPARFAAVRYEDLASDPERETARLYKFLGLDPSEARLDPTSWIGETGQKWASNSSFSNGARFDVAASIKRWRDNLDPIDRGFVEAICKGAMEHWRYDSFGPPADWPEILRRVLPDANLTMMLRLALVNGEGTQAFPTDPVDPANWDFSRRVPPAART
ncbi:hypothetical protein MTBLM1_40209 [Rhodospirillaceae bacterium LM-1]|nr:hypothetical protein MTBLM1_40209 [Rhodospirillaceae bacterium LM-1]